MINKFIKRIKTYFLFAITIIACLSLGNQVLLQIHLRKETKRSSIVNIAGRQRMLSQRITKNALILQVSSPNERSSLVGILQKDLQVFSRAHKKLVEIHRREFVASENDKKLQDLFAKIAPFYTQIFTSGQAIVSTIVTKDGQQAGLQKYAVEIRKAEGSFLYLMDKIVKGFEIQAKNGIQRIKTWEQLFFVFILLVLFLELKFIFYPVLKQFRKFVQTINDLNLELEGALKEARSASKLKADFLSNMSHEIRTPMNGVIGMAELLANTNTSEEQKEYVDTLLSSSNLLLTIINDILDYSKFEADRIEILDEKVEIRNCISDCVKMFQFAIAEKKHEVIVFIKNEVPGFVISDESRLKQVIINLLGNAIKFTPRDGRIYLEVKILQEGENSFILFLIEDSG
ncbi:MAG: histidine kinase dimerization/phospho-acceptor domain-containing protein, partial [Spirochaetota bacterium]